MSEANSNARLSQRYPPSGDSISLFTDENIITMATPKNTQNGQLYAHPSTKKKDVVTRRLRTHD